MSRFPVPLPPGRRLVPGLLILALLAGSGVVSCASPRNPAPTVTVLGPWTGTEAKGFRAMLQGFEQESGIKVSYTGTRDSAAVLASELKHGNPPDLAALTGPGYLDQYASQGLLIPLDRTLNQRKLARRYSPGWRRLMQAAGPDRTLHYYAIFVKATLKSIIWYDPAHLPRSDRALLTSRSLTWSQLIGLTRLLAATGTAPWCMGMADVSRSGWSGTDWIEDIFLHQSGRGLYSRWVAGALPWTARPMRRAWQTFGRDVLAPGLVRHGISGALLTSYGKAGQPMFTGTPGCFLDHEGSFVVNFYTSDKLAAGTGTHPRPGTDFSFVPFPAITKAGRGTAEVSADLLAMFRSTPDAGQLVAYLTRPAAQESWISRSGSGALSANRLVPLSDYPDKISQRLAADMLHAPHILFDASNSMLPVMEDAFNNAVLAYLDGGPGQLSVILSDLDKVRMTVYPAG